MGQAELRNYADDMEEPIKRAERLAKNMSKCPGLRPITVMDPLGITLPFVTSDYCWERWEVHQSRFCDLPNHHTTRLVTCMDPLFIPLNHWLRDPGDGPIDESFRWRTLLQALYPNLSEVVMLIDKGEYYPGILQVSLDLVEDGYKVVLAGYQEQNHDREYVMKRSLAVMKTLDAVLGFPHLRRRMPDVNALVDNLVDRVRKISLREFYASPYGRYYDRVGSMGYFVDKEEEFYRERSIIMRYKSQRSESRQAVVDFAIAPDHQ